ncbi:MAG: peptidylprolyl isomerase [Nitrospirota bacterium]
MMKKRLLSLASVLILLLAGHLLTSGQSFGAVLLDRVVAAVNDEIITWSELRKAIELDGREQMSGLTGEAREKKIKELEKPFLHKLIDMKLQLQEARKLRFNVSASEVDDAVNDIKKKYNLTDEALDNSLRREGLSLQEYRTNLSDQILLLKVINYNVKSKVFISDKAVEDYYRANTGKFQKDEKVKIMQIFFALPADDSKKAAIEAKAQDIMQRIQKGEDFAKLAAEYSENPDRESAWDIGYVKRGGLLKEVEETAFSLKPGENSKPFWSVAGLHIIKIVDRTGSDAGKAREEIKSILFEDAFNLKLDDWIKELRETAYIEITLNN